MAGTAKKRGGKPSQHELTVVSDKSSTSDSISDSAPQSPTMAIPQYDGNDDGDAPLTHRDPNKTDLKISDKATKNVDLGYGCWQLLHGDGAPQVARRPAASTVGQPVKIGLNTFSVKSFPKGDVYQYDVIVGSGQEKRGLILNVWESQTVKQALGNGWIFDGNKLAWSSRSISRELRIMVDLDAERGKTPREGKENKHRVVVRQTNKVAFTVLSSYLNGEASWDNKCLESINFLDHLLRENPKLKYTAIKRNFFAKGQQRHTLGSGVEAFKGCYASLRIAANPAGNGRLSVNVDVANGTFWSASPLHVAAVHLTNRRDVADLVQNLKQGGDRGRSAMDLRKLRKIRVLAKHRGGTPEEFVIDSFVHRTARDVKFEKDGKMISIFDYFLMAYKIRLQYPDLPLVKMTKGKNTLVPMEILTIKENQRYNYKCDEKQTANMIKFAVTPPPARWEAIQHGLGMLDWANDPIHTHFGLSIDPSRTSVDARLLPAPTVKYGVGEAKPGTSGRWDLKGKKFLVPNNVALKSWGVCVISGRRGGKPDKSTIENFTKQFVQIAISHGMKIENKNPAMSLGSGDDVGAMVTACWNAAGNQAQMRPQILVFVLPDKDSATYSRIKRSGECRYGVVTQCMQYGQVQKCQGQYISNVCMKFNAKLGGASCRAVGPKSAGPGGNFGNIPTVVIGADVSHAAPGAQTPSMAAVTVSMDRLALRYAAACENNGFREEMITPANIRTMLKPLLQTWSQNVNNGKFPSQVIYFRDGVSEGQYSHVIKQEVADMKELFRAAGADPEKVKFIVVVCSKRHHIRFFPDRGDRNGNPLPGTIVETGVTHPFENDFYLNSHAAIKGTARPMHYHVLLDETNSPKLNDWLHSLIYDHCYQYIRATTPVSQHPAVYYAHIASNRAIPHDPKWGTTTTGSETTTGTLPDPDKLMEMPSQGQIATSMWYI